MYIILSNAIYSNIVDKILTRNVSDCTQDHKKNLKTMKVEAVEVLVTVENIY